MKSCKADTFLLVLYVILSRFHTKYFLKIMDMSTSSHNFKEFTKFSKHLNCHFTKMYIYSMNIISNRLIYKYAIQIKFSFLFQVSSLLFNTNIFALISCSILFITNSFLNIRHYSQHYNYDLKVRAYTTKRKTSIFFHVLLSVPLGSISFHKKEILNKTSDP